MGLDLLGQLQYYYDRLLQFTQSKAKGSIQGSVRYPAIASRFTRSEAKGRTLQGLVRY